MELNKTDDDWAAHILQVEQNTKHLHKLNTYLKAILCQAQWMQSADTVDEFEFAMEAILCNYESLYKYVSEEKPPNEEDIISFIYGKGGSSEFEAVRPNFERLYLGK